MKIVGLIGFILVFSTMICGQNSKKLIADGTIPVPLKYSLQPTVESLSVEEITAVKTEALQKEVSFEALPQMSSEESNFRKDFELLDVAEGFLIYREIEFRAYLYTAYSQKLKRNYQGIIVLSISDNGTKFSAKAHYVYKYQGDRYIRVLPDINGNILNEIAVFSEFQTKKNYRKMVRIIEFSPDGLLRLGANEIYSSIPQKQRSPKNSDKNRAAKRIYISPLVNASKLYVEYGIGKTLRFFAENLNFSNERWIAAENSNLEEIKLVQDSVNYVEIVKPIFPKSLGER